jgi:hypothetical protein
MPVQSRVSGRSTVAGGVLLVLGLWGALVPFVGPSFGYGMGGVAAWTWTESHATLHLAPGVAAIVGAFFLLRGRGASQTVGALLAMAGGIWFVIAPSLHPLWAGQGTTGMSGMGDSAASSALSALGYHYGTGVLIAIVATYTLGILGHARRAPAGDVRGESRRPNRVGATDSTLVGAQN